MLGGVLLHHRVVMVVMIFGGDTSPGEKKGVTEDMPRLNEKW